MIRRTRNEFGAVIERYDDETGVRTMSMIDEGQTDEDVEALAAEARRDGQERRVRWSRFVAEQYGGDEDAAREAVWSTSLAQRQQQEFEVSQAFRGRREEAARLRRATDDLRRDAPP